MEMRKTILFVGLMVAFALLTTVPLVLAGGGPEPPPPDAVIQDGELWGTVVVYCPTIGTPFAVVRVKRVVQCVVETQAVVDPATSWSCAGFDESAPLNSSLPGVTFFTIVGTPFITKVKNYSKDDQSGNYVHSFDAQFKFYTTQ